RGRTDQRCLLRSGGATSPTGSGNPSAGFGGTVRSRGWLPRKVPALARPRLESRERSLGGDSWRSVRVLGTRSCSAGRANFARGRGAHHQPTGGTPSPAPAIVGRTAAAPRLASSRSAVGCVLEAASAWGSLFKTHRGGGRAAGSVCTLALLLVAFGSPGDARP